MTNPSKSEASLRERHAQIAALPLEKTAGGHMTHDQVANWVRMLRRDDLDHEAACTVARDRIVWLAGRVAELEAALSARDEAGADWRDLVRRAWEWLDVEAPNDPLTEELYVALVASTRSTHQPTAPASGEVETLARLFHDTYERLAPSFGYETRKDTRAFDPTSANGRLMIAVCAELRRRLAAVAPDLPPDSPSDPLHVRLRTLADWMPALLPGRSLDAKAVLIEASCRLAAVVPPAADDDLIERMARAICVFSWDTATERVKNECRWTARRAATALAAVAPAGMDGWQPIATAPKDGTTVLLYSPDRCGNCPEGTPGIGNARWLGEEWITGRLLTGAFVKVAHQPTHWQPLPTPPATAGKENGHAG